MSMNKNQGTSYNEGNFKFYDYFDALMLKHLTSRNGIAYFSGFGLVDSALREGFNVLDANGKVWSEQEKLDELVKPLMKDIIKGCGNEATYSANTFVLETAPKRTGDDKESLSIFNVTELTPGYHIEFDKWGRVEKLEYQKNIADREPEDITIEKAKLDTTLFIMLRPSEDNIRKGESKLGPIWDNLVALGAVGNNSACYIIRVGAGLKVMYLPLEDFMDDDTRTKVEKYLKSLNSINSVMIAPTRSENISGKTELDINTGGGAINFQEVFDVNASFVANYLKVPLNVIKGIFQGETTGATITRSLFYESLQIIQQDYEFVYKWLVEILAKKGFISALPENYQIDHRYKYEVSEGEAVIIETDRLANASQYLNVFGVDPNKALEAAGLETISPFNSKEDLDQTKMDMMGGNEEEQQEQGDDKDDDNTSNA